MVNDKDHERLQRAIGCGKDAARRGSNRIAARARVGGSLAELVLYSGTRSCPPAKPRNSLKPSLLATPPVRSVIFPPPPSRNPNGPPNPRSFHQPEAPAALHPAIL